MVDQQDQGGGYGIGDGSIAARDKERWNLDQIYDIFMSISDKQTGLVDKVGGSLGESRLWSRDGEGGINLASIHWQVIDVIQ
jgi:hypothetical protein